MEWKDYALIAAVVLLIGGPIALHFRAVGKGKLRKGPQETDSIINDNVRLGTAITTVGGRTVAEGAKALKLGSLRYNNREHGKQQQQVGGA
jgi:hypothetical protein